MILTFEKKEFLLMIPSPHGILRDFEFRGRTCGTDLYSTSSHQVAARYASFADKRAERELGRFYIRQKPLSGRFVTWPKSETPKPYQVPAAKFALERNRSYLALDPGLGKGIITALIINALEGWRFVLLVPPGLVADAQGKLQQWATRVLDIKVYDPKREEDAEVLIVPDSYVGRASVSSFIKLTGALGNSCLIVDEAHRYKTPSAKRTLALLGRSPLIDYFDKTVLLSGTPMPNRPLELYPVLKRCAPETIDFMDKMGFGMKYCGGHIDEDTGHWDFSGESNFEELAARMRESFMLRLKQEDVLKELPPYDEGLIFIGENVPPTLAKLDAKLLREFSPDDIYKFEKGNEHISTYRKNLGELKVKFACQYFKDILEGNNEKIVIFAIHKKVIATLKSELAGFDFVVIDGTTPKHQRQPLVNRIATDARCRGLIGNIEAAGIGYTITSANRVFFVESAWGPESNKQAWKRVHRIGQTRSVFIYHMVFKNSLDRKTIETNLRKRKTIAKL